MTHCVTPTQRADQFPDDLNARIDGLWCTWCDRQLNHKRKDTIIDHLKSRVHNDNKRAKKAMVQGISHCVDPVSQLQNDDGKSLRKLFEESDSDSAASFEGFDSPEPGRQPQSNTKLNTDVDGDESRRSGRQRKRPARLSEDVGEVGGIADQATFISTMAKKRKTDSDRSPSSSPPARMRSMPIKKQISFSARASDSSPPSSPVKKTPLKMKFSRKSAKQPDSNTEKNMKVVSKPSSGKGLKLKFIWKKKQSSKSSDVNESSRDSAEISQAESDYDDIVHGIEDSLVGDKKNDSSEEIVEEEIVEMREDHILAQSDSNRSTTSVKINSTKVAGSGVYQSKTTSMDNTKKHEKTTEELTPKKPKFKKVTPTADDKKRKVTAYMIWSKQMREKISKRFPGLEFGDVSKKLGDMWKKMPEKEKQMWKVRNKATQQAETESSAATVRKGGSKMIETGPKKPPPQTKYSNGPPLPVLPDPEMVMNRELGRLPPPSMEPLDSAAYLSLLGESFNTLSVKTRMGSQVVQGADTMLLDSLLCAMIPLISLLRQIPELRDCVDHSTLRNCFSNIAHIVPGL